MADSTIPPPPAISSKRAPLPTLPEEAIQAATAERVAREGRQIARAATAKLEAHEATIADHDERLAKLEGLVGELPSALPGARGSGLAQHFVDLGVKLDALAAQLSVTTQAIEADRKERAQEAATEAKRREPWSKAAWIAVGASLAIVVGAATTEAMHRLLSPQPQRAEPAAHP